jgi:hypothetical protein
MPTLRSSEFESGTVTRLPLPLKLSAPPKRPAVVQVAPVMVPLLPVPETSGTLVPDPWSML